MANPPRRLTRRNAARPPVTFSGLLAELKSLGVRSREALGDAYARAASGVLHGLEHLEDSSAERAARRGRSRSATDPA